jgi:hypothetical protein
VSAARRFGVALIHHPVLGRNGETLTSAITNLDVHDIARSARTYGAAVFYLVHPIEAQRALVARIVEHWTVGSSAARIPTRKEALRLAKCTPSLADAVSDFGACELWATSASALLKPTDYPAARARLESPGPPVLLLLGTSWGLGREITDQATLSLAPIAARSPSGFNHLSVRAACAIILDRLLG